MAINCTKLYYKLTEGCVTALDDLVSPPCLQDCIPTDQTMAHGHTDFAFIGGLVVLLLLLTLIGGAIYYFWTDIVDFGRRTPTWPQSARPTSH